MAYRLESIVFFCGFLSVNVNQHVSGGGVGWQLGFELVPDTRARSLGLQPP